MTVSHIFTGKSEITLLSYMMVGKAERDSRMVILSERKAGTHWTVKCYRDVSDHPQALCVSVCINLRRYHLHFSLVPLRWNFKPHNIGTCLYRIMLRETAEKKSSQNPIRDQVNERTPNSFFKIHYAVVVVLLNKERICLQRRRPGFDLWVGKIPWRREWLPTPGFLPEEFLDRGAWRATVHGVAKSQTRLKN